MFNKKGFTLVELLLVIGIFAILATLTSISFFSTFSQSNLGASKDVLIADIKTAQASAMAGEGVNGIATDGWGMIVNNNSQYTIFPGTVYDPGNSRNVSTMLADDIAISTTFPSSKIVFNHATGEVIGYAAGQDSITLTGANTTFTIRLNQYGTIVGD